MMSSGAVSYSEIKQLNHLVMVSDVDAWCRTLKGFGDGLPEDKDRL